MEEKKLIQRVVKPLALAMGSAEEVLTGLQDMVYLTYRKKQQTIYSST